MACLSSVYMDVYMNVSVYACLWLWYSAIHKKFVHTLCPKTQHRASKCLTRVQSSAQARSRQQGMHKSRHITEESKQKAQSCHCAEKACAMCSLSTRSFFMHTKTTHTPRRKRRCAFVGGRQQGVQP